MRKTPSRLERVIKTLSKRHERTLTHIKNYIRLVVNIKGHDKLVITVDKRNTIEALVNQIEAEHAFDFPDDGVLECGLLYDRDLNVLAFDTVIGDVLDMYSRVFVTNIREDPNVINARKYKNYQHVDEREKARPKKPKSSEEELRAVLSGQVPKEPVKIASPEERFQAILHNQKALELFKDFCIEKRVLEYLLFWLEVETLQVIDPSQRLLTMKFIYLTYISDQGPLKINISSELKKDIEFPTANTNVSVFDDAQEYVYAVLKRQAFAQFEKSSKISVLQNLRTNRKKTVSNHINSWSINLI